MDEKNHIIIKILIVAMPVIGGVLYSWHCLDNYYSLYEIIIYTSINIIIPFYISVIIHELGHLVACQRVKRKVRLISIIGICIYRINGILKFKYDITGLLGAGRIIPQFNNITSEVDIEYEVFNMYKICLGGVKATLIFLTISIIIYFCGYKDVFISSLLFCNSYILINSMLKHKFYIGDMYIYMNKKLLKDFIESILFMYSVQFNEVEEFFYNYMFKKVNCLCVEEKINNSNILIINQIFQYDISNNIHLKNQNIIAEYGVKNMEHLLKCKDINQIQIHILFHNIIEYLIVNKADYIKSKEILDSLKKNKTIFDTMNYSWLKYYTVKTQQLVEGKCNGRIKYKEKANIRMGLKI